MPRRPLSRLAVALVPVVLVAACSSAKPHAAATKAAGDADTDKAAALAWARAHQHDADVVVSSIHQLNGEVGRVLPATGDTASERNRAVALATQLGTSLAAVETDLIRSTDAASNGETLALRGVTELRAAMTALSDWDAGARIVWSMAGLSPPLP